MQATTKGQFRADIQALRTVAILLVVVFHLWPNYVAGGYIGVDIFFVVSGFLITSHLLRDLEQKSFSITNFWAKRIRRLLPATLTVLAATGLSIFLFAPKSLWSQWFSEVISSVFFIENWVLAVNAVDYLALGNSSSPSQHFWALGVEEQFYLIWPLLIGLALVLVPKSNPSIRRKSIFSFLACATAASLAYGVYLTNTDPALAYFSTPVRAWEFGVGALTAFLPSIANRFWSPFLAGISFVCLVFVGISYNTQISFPGTAALLPVVATALALWASANSGLLGKVFSFRPVQWIGDHSFSIYLWHWPLIILAPYVLQVDQLTDQAKLVILALTLILSALTLKFIERPAIAMGKRPRVKSRMIFVSVLVASLSISGLSWYAMDLSRKPITQSVDVANELAKTFPKCFGAQAMVLDEDKCLNKDLVGLYPSIEAASSDHGIDKNLCDSVGRTDWKPKECQIGKADGNIRIALVGDSHIGQYRGAFTRMAEINSWSVNVYAKGGCPFTTTQRVNDEQLTEACRKWIVEVRKELVQRNYDLVVTSQASGVEWTTRSGQTQQEAAESGLVEAWSDLVRNGIPVLAIKDNPRPVAKVLRCLELKAVSECSNVREKAFLYDPQVAAVEKMTRPRVVLVDLDNYFCGIEVCKPVIGHAIVYRDANHLTNTFALTLSPFIQPYVLNALSNQ